MQVHFVGHTFTIASVSFPIPKGHIGGRFPARAGMMVSHGNRFATQWQILITRQ